jgi:hypothetical protein
MNTTPRIDRDMIERHILISRRLRAAEFRRAGKAAIMALAGLWSRPFRRLKGLLAAPRRHAA